MIENIIVLLGGRVAEKLILDDISTGASNDLERATATARNMVTRYGFSDNLGPVVYGRGEHEVFLGRDYSSTPSYSENVAAEIDSEIRSIVEDCYSKCETILREHMDKLHVIAKYLMKYEKIDGKDFEKLMKGEIGEADLIDIPSEPVASEPVEVITAEEEELASRDESFSFETPTVDDSSYSAGNEADPENKDDSENK
jgi:cell division protease FtsH